MLMLFSNKLKNLPFDRAMPYDDNDLLIIMEPNIAFRLSNLISDNNDNLSIRLVMEKQEVFACKNFDVRMNSFAPIMNSRIERYFETEKSSYLFFDEEEQEALFRIFNGYNLNCHVDIYMHDGVSFSPVVLEELNPQIANNIIRHLTKIGARGVLESREYYNYKVIQYKKTKEAFKRFKRQSRNEMGLYFARYSKLKDISSKKAFKRYFRLLLSKYHPDANSSEDANEFFVIINNDLESIKQTGWYRKLQE